MSENCGMDAAGKREKDKMEIYWKSFKQMFDVLKKDKMLLAACIAPVLAGVLFRFGVPRLEQALCAGLHDRADPAVLFCRHDSLG